MSVSEIMDPAVTGGAAFAPGTFVRDHICELDRHLLSLTSDCGLDLNPAQISQVEELAAWNIGLIASVVIYSARIKLHRFRAFSDIPIFLEKHCDLTFIKMDDLSAAPPSSWTASHLDSTFPFSKDESSVICLKSSLAVSRAFRGFSYPAAFLSETSFSQPEQSSLQHTTTPAVSGSDGARYPGTLPYFKCAAMQASYAFYNLVIRIRAAMSSNRLSTCYALLCQPEPATEVQDARRLIEELRSGVHCLTVSMKLDIVFEGIAAMIRDLDAVYFSLFPC